MTTLNCRECNHPTMKHRPIYILRDDFTYVEEFRCIGIGDNYETCKCVLAPYMIENHVLSEV